MPPEEFLLQELSTPGSWRLSGDGVEKEYRPGEPIFVLRAQDKFAPEIVLAWAKRLEIEEKLKFEKETVTHYDAGYPPQEFQPSYKVREAKAFAYEMMAWQQRNDCKVPD